MKIVRNFVLVALATSVLAACGGGGGSSVASTPINPQPIPSGGGSSVLATQTLKGAAGFINSAGFTVYVFDLDLTNPGQSTCNAGNGCSRNWPQVRPPGVMLTGKFGQIDRTDGTKQLTYAGRPLYTFVADGRPGQTSGDGLVEFGGLWHIARPQATTPGPSPMPTPTRY